MMAVIKTKLAKTVKLHMSYTQHVSNLNYNTCTV
jgi:hypothetical protein